MVSKFMAGLIVGLALYILLTRPRDDGAAPVRQWEPPKPAAPKIIIRMKAK